MATTNYVQPLATKRSLAGTRGQPDIFIITVPKGRENIKNNQIN